LKPLKVVPCLFQQSNCEHESQWADVCKHEADFERRDKLREANQQEEKIEEEFELVEEHDRDKGQAVVLSVVYLVVQVGSRPVTLAS
jgi:uncharacterized protein with NRDE domain